jgi:hypothetical protein
MMLSLCSLFFCGVASNQFLSGSIWSLMDLWLSSRTNQLWCYYNWFWEVATYGTHQRGLNERNSALARIWNLYRSSFLSKAYDSRERLHVGPITTTKCMPNFSEYIPWACFCSRPGTSFEINNTHLKFSKRAWKIDFTYYMEVIHQGAPLASNPP